MNPASQDMTEDGGRGCETNEKKLWHAPLSPCKHEQTESIDVIHCCWMYDYLICMFDALELRH